MKVIKTELNDAEYQLLAHYAEKHCLTLKKALRQAARFLVLSDKVDPSDPFFTHQPVAPATGKTQRTSVEHDKLLYGYKKKSRPMFGSNPKLRPFFHKEVAESHEL